MEHVPYIMKKIVLIVSLLLAVLLHACSTQEATCEEGEIYYQGTCRADLLDQPFSGLVGETYLTSQIEADLDAIKSDIVRNHPLYFTDIEEITQMIDELKQEAVDEMSELEVLRLYSPLFHLLRCGHSYISLSEKTAQEFESMSVFFPLGLYVYQNELYVTNNTTNPLIQKGSKILTINGDSAETIIANLYSMMSSDGYNTTFMKDNISKRFYYYYTLLLSENSGYYVTYQPPGDSEYQERYLEGETLSYMDYITNDFSYALTTSYEDTYAVLSLPTFSSSIYSMSYFHGFIDAFFQKVDEDKIESIVIDLRGNSGGDPYYSSYLFRYIAKEEQPYFKSGVWGYDDLTRTLTHLNPHFAGDVYVLIDGLCFSSTGHVLALIEYQDFATFIGEESGASYVAMDASRFFNSDISGLRYKLSTHAYEVRVEGMEIGRGIIPDYEIVPTVEEVIDYQDPVLNFTIDLILEE